MGHTEGVSRGRDDIFMHFPYLSRKPSAPLQQWVRLNVPLHSHTITSIRGGIYGRSTAQIHERPGQPIACARMNSVVPAVDGGGAGRRRKEGLQITGR
jgi:hypothetical protein